MTFYRVEFQGITPGGKPPRWDAVHRRDETELVQNFVLKEALAEVQRQREADSHTEFTYAYRIVPVDDPEGAIYL